MSIETGQTEEPRRGAIPVDSFANRLMLARAHAGHLSIREAADLCDVGRGAWTNWEKGARPGDIIELAAVVAQHLGVDREWLLFGGPLGEAESRALRRTSRRSGNVRLISNLNDSSARLIRAATEGSADTARRRPINRVRHDPARPVSAIPMTRRRPAFVRPGDRPIPHE